jgi:S1-C subfamily serine protease
MFRVLCCLAVAVLATLASPRMASSQVPVGGGEVNALGVKAAKKHPGTPGVTIVLVKEGSPGSQPDPKPGGGATTLDKGDIIFRVNNHDVSSVKEFNKIINAIPPGQTVYIRARDGQTGAWFDWKVTMP